MSTEKRVKRKAPRRPKGVLHCGKRKSKTAPYSTQELRDKLRRVQEGPGRYFKSYPRAVWFLERVARRPINKRDRASLCRLIRQSLTLRKLFPNLKYESAKALAIAQPKKKAVTKRVAQKRLEIQRLKNLLLHFKTNTPQADQIWHKAMEKVIRFDTQMNKGIFKGYAPFLKQTLDRLIKNNE